MMMLSLHVLALEHLSRFGRSETDVPPKRVKHVYHELYVMDRMRYERGGSLIRLL
jgi:hypothetical protein